MSSSEEEIDWEEALAREEGAIPSHPPKRLKTSGEARAERSEHHSTEEDGARARRTAAAAPIAPIEALDGAMQRSIAGYMGIREWAELRRASKLLRPWPRPPPPRDIDYHLIRFSVGCDAAVACGVAKTLASVREAYKHVTNERFDLRDGEETRLMFEFVHVDGYDAAAAVPLVEFEEREALSCYDRASRLHPLGKDDFGAKNAATMLPDTSDVKWMIASSAYGLDENGGRTKKLCAGGKEILLNYYENIEDAPYSAGAKQRYDGLVFDDEDDIAPLVWLDGIKPSIDINLKHLVWRRGTADREMYFGSQRTNEIWIDKDTAQHYPLRHIRHFYVSSDNTWSICLESTHLWTPD